MSISVLFWIARKFYGLEIDLNYLINNEWATRLFADSIIGKLDTVGDVPRMPPYRIGSEINYDNSKIKKELNFKTRYSLQDKII